MKASARYAKIVEWSDDDNCYVEARRDSILGGCHGDDEQVVFEELCQIVEESNRTLREKMGSLSRQRHLAVTSPTACRVSPNTRTDSPRRLRCFESMP